MRSLFTVRADEAIDKEAVEEFCRLGIAETTRVEYKREFPTDLAKSISSFANTQGGIILIGVDADSENKPILPLTGMALIGQPEERVYQVCSNAIYPPVFPEVWSVRFEDQSQASRDRIILIVRVQQGETARSVDGRRGIYVRTGNINNLFERATVDDVVNLLGRKMESAELRKQLISRSDERFSFFFDEYVAQKQKEVLDSVRPLATALLRRTPIIRMRLVPVYPGTRVAPIATWRNALKRLIAWRDVGPRFDPFPPALRERTAQDSFIRLRQTRILELAEFTEHGLISFFYNDFQDAKCILANHRNCPALWTLSR